jgi:hypothetical protein
MNRISVLASIVLIFCLGQPVSAKDLDGEYAVFGAGSNTCAAFDRARNSGRTSQYVVWTEAYLSAFNLIVPSTYNIAGESSFNQMMSWLGQYCLENPEELYVNAVAALTVALYPSRLNLAPGKDNSQKWTEPLK